MMQRYLVKNISKTHMTTDTEYMYLTRRSNDWILVSLG